MSLGNQGPKTMSLPGSGSNRKVAGDGVSDQFPAGLRVLLVDDDPTCLMILEKMLRTCLYEVTKSNRAEIALSLLRENRNGYDIIISDVHMPDMDGFKLLEQVGLDMDLPVIMMSADDSKSVVMKGVTHGACDYLIKPVRIEALKNIWQHVVRRKKHEWKDLEQSGSIEEGERRQKPDEDGDYSSSANEGNWRNSKRRKEEEDEAEDKDDTSALKKPRVVWSVELHQQFMAAVDQLGVDKAVPKKILELMNVPGLTRENVASHLQKYRLYLRRLNGGSQHHSGLNNPFVGPRDASFGSMSSINGLDLQALAASGHLPPQSLANLQAATLARSLPKSTISMPILDQRNNIFSFENPPKSTFGENNSTKSSYNNSISNNKQVNLLHGIPTAMEPKQLASLRGINMQQANSRVRDGGSSLMVQQMNNFSNNNNNNSNNNNAQLSRLSSFSTNGVFSRNVYSPVSQQSSMVDFSANGNSADNNNIINNNNKGVVVQEEVNLNLKGSRGFDPSYDIFNELAQHNKTDDWDLPNTGLSFESTPHVNSGLNVQPSVMVHQGFSSGLQNNVSMNNNNVFSSGQSGLQNRNLNGNLNPLNMGQQLNTFVGESSTRIKSETIPEISCQNTLFSDQYGQEDLLSALLKQQDNIGSVTNDFGFDGFHLDNLPV